MRRLTFAVVTTNDKHLYGSMRAASDGQPECGSTARELGVRPTDIRPNRHGNVKPGVGGMSVSPDSPRNLPTHRKPPSLGGDGRDPVWCISLLGRALRYRPDRRAPSEHGFVEPAATIHVTKYKRALCQTRARWEESNV